ncbi:MAG: polysaccharide pyruvyl transferase family protein [Acidobacteriota bacterium]
MITLFCIRPKGFNVGNDTIFIGMQHFINEAFGEVVNLISLPATSRYESQAKAGLTAQTIHEINQYGHGVIVGGGNLYENGELQVGLDSLESLEVPMVLFSLSRGRIYNRQHRMVNRTDAMPDRVIRALNLKASHSLARDKATLAYLHSIGCTGAQLGGCPTLFLDRMLHRLPSLPENETPGVLISVRNPSLMNIPLQKQSQVYRDINKVVEFLHGEGHRRIRLLCHDHRDIAFAASFPGLEYVYTGDVYSYLSLLRACELNITYRLHSFLPCLAFGTPTIKLSYDERAMSLTETIGMEAWNIDMINCDDVIRAVTRRYFRLDELKSLRASALPVWNGFYESMLGTFRQFAAKVRACHEQAQPACEMVNG